MGDLRVGWLNRNEYQTPQDTRLYWQSAFVPGRSGLLGDQSAAALTGATPMEADIAPFTAVIAGTEAGDQGDYPVALPAAKRITFAPGESSVTRVDQVIAHVMDADYDDSGTHDGDVEVLPGDSATGAAVALPPDSMLLHEVAVPAGASAGGSGIPWSSAVTSRRAWSAAAGGALPVADKTARDRITTPSPGMTITRLDIGAVEMWNGTAWRTQGAPALASTADLSKLDGYEGQVAVVGGDVWRRHSGAWSQSPRGLIAARQCYTTWPKGATDGSLAAGYTFVVGASNWEWPNAATLPMQFDIALDPARTYRLDGFIDIIDSDTANATFKASILRSAPSADVTTGTTVALQYGAVPSASFGFGPAVSMWGYVSGLSGTIRFAMCLNPIATGNLRIGGHYNFAISDIGTADLLTSQ